MVRHLELERHPYPYTRLKLDVALARGYPGKTKKEHEMEEEFMDFRHFLVLDNFSGLEKKSLGTFLATLDKTILAAWTTSLGTFLATLDRK